MHFMKNVTKVGGTPVSEMHLRLQLSFQARLLRVLIHEYIL